MRRQGLCAPKSMRPFGCMPKLGHWLGSDSDSAELTRSSVGPSSTDVYNCNHGTVGVSRGSVDVFELWREGIVTSSGDENVLLLETINPLDMTPDDLDDLALSIREVVDQPVAVAYEEQYGAGVSWHEVLQLWLPDEQFFRDSTWGLVLGAVFENMRQRFNRRGGERRPKTIIVRKTNGAVQEEWTIETIDSEPTRAEADQSPPRRRPPIKRRHG